MLTRRLAAAQVYDLTLSAALKTQKCGPLKLTVEGEWRWLLERFAGGYGICSSYATLAHLRWVMRYILLCYAERPTASVQFSEGGWLTVASTQARKCNCAYGMLGATGAEAGAAEAG